MGESLRGGWCLVRGGGEVGFEDAYLRSQLFSFTWNSWEVKASRLIRREGEVKRVRVSPESSVFHIVIITPVKAVVGLKQCGILGELDAHGSFRRHFDERNLCMESVLIHMKVTFVGE